jgi:urease accessory protein
MNTHVALPVPASTGTHWHASLALQFRHTQSGTRLVHSRHEGPLYVQRPFYPEGSDLAHVYLLHPPGGLVSGDRLQVSLDLASQTRVLCTTPGAGRVYRARSDKRLQEQLNQLQVATDASLEWFPQETIVFPGAHAALETRVELAAGARFTGWELVVLGLPAVAERFDSGELRQRLRIDVAGRPVLIEHLWLDAASSLHRAACGLQGQMVSGIFFCGPFPAAQSGDETFNALRTIQARSPSRCGVTRLGDFIVGRYLGTCAEEARRCFVALWQVLRPLLLQRPACSPAIWST